MQLMKIGKWALKIAYIIIKFSVLSSAEFNKPFFSKCITITEFTNLYLLSRFFTCITDGKIWYMMFKL